MDARARRIRAGMAAVALGVAAVTTGGAVLRVGPFESPTAHTVTAPDEILAGSLQALLDAETVHLSIEVSGSIPGGVVGADGPIRLRGVGIEADVDLAAGRSGTLVDADGADGPDLEVRTVWDRAWVGAVAGPWTVTAVSEVLDVGAVDLNPLTLVERVRAYLAEHPETRLSRSRDLPCIGGLCRVVTLDAGPEPVGLLAALLPAERAAHLPDADVTLTLQAQVATLRPVVAFLEVSGPAGEPILEAAIRFRNWNEPVTVEEPSPGT